MTTDRLARLRSWLDSLQSSAPLFSNWLEIRELTLEALTEVEQLTSVLGAVDGLLNDGIATATKAFETSLREYIAKMRTP